MKAVVAPTRPVRPTVGGKTYVGIDNGVSGSIGIIPLNGVGAQFHHTPTFSSQTYTKKKANITRVDVAKLVDILRGLTSPFAILERPMVNPGRFTATTSALRALEALLISLEMCNIPYMFVDSKEWQSVLLPRGTKGADDLKKASLDIGTRLFPQFKHLFKKDADGLLMAEWARRANL